MVEWSGTGAKHLFYDPSFARVRSVRDWFGYLKDLWGVNEDPAVTEYLSTVIIGGPADARGHNSGRWMSQRGFLQESNVKDNLAQPFTGEDKWRTITRESVVHKFWLFEEFTGEVKDGFLE